MGGGDFVSGDIKLARVTRGTKRRLSPRVSGGRLRLNEERKILRGNVVADAEGTRNGMPFSLNLVNITKADDR